MASDRIVLPPSRRETESPQGRFRLVVQTLDGWKTPRPQAVLERRQGAQWQTAWSRELPHHHGPREVLVTDDGSVLLVDEFINVTSRWALMLLDVNDQLRLEMDHAGVVRALGVGVGPVAAAARMGVWLAGKPVLDASQRHALIPAGGRVLSVRMTDGQVSVAGA